MSQDPTSSSAPPLTYETVRALFDALPPISVPPDLDRVKIRPSEFVEKDMVYRVQGEAEIMVVMHPETYDYLRHTEGLSDFDIKVLIERRFAAEPEKPRRPFAGGISLEGS